MGSRSEGDSHVTSAVKFESGLKTDDALDITLGLKLCEGFLGSVEVGHVGLVVFGMVEVHNLRRDGRLQRLLSASRIPGYSVTC